MTVAKYNSQDEKTHSIILLSLLDEVLYEVVDETTAGVWKKLEKLYMTKSLTNKLLLKQGLFSLRMKECSALKYHLDALNSILMDLKNVEVKIDDEDAPLILLVSLPPSFENFVNSFVVATGHNRGRHQAQKGKGKGRYKGRSKSRPRGSNPQDTCNYCKEKAIGNSIVLNSRKKVRIGLWHMKSLTMGMFSWITIHHEKLLALEQFRLRCMMEWLEPSLMFAIDRWASRPFCYGRQKETKSPERSVKPV
uniref:Retrovirus-related Pol polyprotein from transposon TNT 1-94 n=1 Tax=Tanacetum cinerariifolium TaxID=118510 RepID=A0A6L2N6B2_TANCI|nr:retrovirus-related Pol polyprotein from transposon TNT 1-94 [Tanacetum cinerariifolium]